MLIMPPEQDLPLKQLILLMLVQLLWMLLMYPKTGNASLFPMDLQCHLDAASLEQQGLDTLILQTGNASFLNKSPTNLVFVTVSLDGVS